MKKLILFALFLLPLAVSAASFNGVVVTAAPENPRPGDRVTLTATLLDSQPGNVYTWEQDGTRVAEGVDAKTYSLDAPPAGHSTQIDVAVTNGAVVVGTGSITLRPSEVTIEWEGLGATPPFYVGKPLMTSQGQLRATAVTALTTARGIVSTTNILFTWKVNGSVLQQNSGFGKNTAVVTPPFYDDAFSLGVTATARDGSLTAESTVYIQPVAPQAVVYEVTPLGGVEDGRAVVSSYPFALDEVSFLAYPLYADANNLTFTWSLDGAPVTVDTGNPRLAVFKKTGSGSGSHSIGVSYENPTKFLTRAAGSFLLTF